MPKRPDSSFLKPWCGYRDRQVTVKQTKASKSHHRGNNMPLRPAVPFSSNHHHLWLRPLTWKTQP